MTVLSEQQQPAPAGAAHPLDYPRLRHCTFVERGEDRPMTMVVGQDYYEIDEELGSREQFLNVKRYFDGRHTLAQIGAATGVDVDDIAAIVAAFTELGLMRAAEPLELIPADAFVKQIEDSCVMWSRQIGYHRLFSGLESHTLRREVFVGLVQETYHYVKSANKHIATAIAHCNDPALEPLLNEYFVEEYDHAGLMLDTLERLGVPREWAVDAHPIIGTMSLVNMLCDIARQDTLAYLTCTVLFEARGEDFQGAAAAMRRIAAGYGWPEDAVDPLIRHMGMDVEAGHSSLLSQALAARPLVPAAQAHRAVNFLHDLKHSFDQFHDQIIQYYSDISNYIPRVRVDYFSL